MEQNQLTPHQIELVQSTYKKVAVLSEQTAEMFYIHLFQIAPETKSLFHDADMKNQRKKLMQTIGVAVGSLAQPNLLVPALTELGKRHKTYGVRDEMYQLVGETLLWVLESI